MPILDRLRPEQSGVVVGIELVVEQFAGGQSVVGVSCV
jgi:hypothetical protein